MEELAFLHSAAALYALSQPIVARSLLRRVTQLSIGQQIPLSAGVQQTFCQRCHSLFVAGVNCRVSTSSTGGKTLAGASSKVGKRGDRVARHLIVQCTACSCSTRYPLATRSDLEKLNEPRAAAEAFQFQAVLSLPLPQTQSPAPLASSSSKKPKKKKKNLQLALLLNKAKEKEGESSNQLSLDNFLQDLN